MCPANCNEILRSSVTSVIASPKGDSAFKDGKIVDCFYKCLKKEFIKRASIIYNYYPDDFIDFVSDSSFTDSILLLIQKAASGELYDGNASIKTVLSAFYMNTLRKQLQTENRLIQKKERHKLDIGEDGLEIDEENGDELESRHLLIEAALAAMEPEDRQIIKWRHLEEKRCDEIADMLGISTASATNRIYRCMQRLRAVIKSSLHQL